MTVLFHARSGFFEKHNDFFSEPGRYPLFFLGVGGASVSVLARYAKKLGFPVFGSDRSDSPEVSSLRSLGIPIAVGHRRDNLPDTVKLLVYSLAISADNPEYRKARELGIETVSRAEFLGALMRRFDRRIGISGSHGKSTVTAMTARIFTDAGRDPTVFSGAGLDTDGPSYRFGGTETLLYEACEYRDSFLCFSPTAAVALNLELDHTDYFPDLSSLRASFLRSLLSAERFALLCADDPNLSQIAHGLPADRLRTFGCAKTADYRIGEVSDGSFTLSLHGQPLGRFSLAVPGGFQIKNAAAAIAVAHEYGIGTDVIRASLASFRGIPRRMQKIGTFRGSPVFYDYAHHPTEIASVIPIARGYGRPVTAVFRPHTFSRTRALWGDFVSALSAADRVILLPVDPVREEAIPGVTSERLAEAIGTRAVFLTEEKIGELPDLLGEGENTVLLLGAADMEPALSALRSQKDFQKNDP